jgi:hypothetical protein
VRAIGHCRVTWWDAETRDQYSAQRVPSVGHSHATPVMRDALGPGSADMEATRKN